MIFFDFWASAVVSFENGFKSPYFSSFFCALRFFVFSSFFGVAFVEISDFLFFIFWLSRSFRLKKASKHLIFHFFFRVLRFFVFSASVGVWYLCTYKLLTLYLSCT